MNSKFESLEDITFSVTYTLTYMNTSPTAVEGFSSEFTFTARASQDRDGGTWGAGGAPPYSIRSANVSQLDGGGGQIMPTTLLLPPPPRDFQTFHRACRTSSNHFPFRSNGLFYSSDLYLDAFCLILTHSDALTHPPPQKRWS